RIARELEGRELVSILGLRVVAALTLTAVPLSSVGSAAGAAPLLTPAAALVACTNGHDPGATLTASDLPYLRQFVPCVARELRGQLGLQLRKSRKVSRAAAS